MRPKVRRPFEEFERRPGAGWDQPASGEGGPGGHAHRPHDHRGRRGGRGGPGGRGRDRGRDRGRGRIHRGDVRTAILLVLADEPMHGYQIMQAMSDRTGGAWRPSPGAVYPTIAQLEDERLVTTQEEGGRRLVTLTEEGRTYVTERSARLGDPFAAFADRPAGPDLRDPLHELHAAARQIASSGSAAQVEAAAEVLTRARRSLYLILAGEAEDTSE
jgi:DNA-binding PadR family transcriptional regulator